MYITINSMNYIRDSVQIDNINNTVCCYITDNPLTLDLRREWIQMGEKDAFKFLKKNSN